MNGKGVRERQRGRMGTTPGRQRQQLRARPIVMALEERWMLSTLVVNNPTDNPVAGETDLRQAIAEANGLVGANTIAFDSSVFNSPQLMTLTSGPLVLSATGGTETILGPAAGLTVDGGGLSGVFQVNPGVTAAISGLTITGGNKPNGAGGGLFDDGATLTLTNCYITGNSSGGNGGGVYSDGGTLSLAYCVVSGNSAPNGKGGGLATDNAAVTLTDCVISGNTASQGGGMNAAGDDGAATLTNSTFSGNHAGSGSVAGLYFDGVAATLTDCDVTGNYGAGMALGDGVAASLSYCSVSGNYGVGLATGDGGTTTLKYCSISTNLSSTAVGGLLIGNDDTATLTDCSISGNSASGNGGGLFNNGTAALTYCSISGNTAIGDGGGLYNSGTATMTHCTVAGNTASGDGGGVVNVGGTATLNYSTLAGNYAGGSGGGLANMSGSAVLANCIVVGNSASDDGGGVYNLATTALAECTVEGNTASDFGGGLWNSGAASTMTLTQCTVSGNTATLGAGGLGNIDGLSTVTESTVYGNDTGPTGSGGGSDTGSSGTTILINCTVTGNSAGVDGGGLYNSGLTRLTNCTISGNTATSGGGIFNSLLYADSNVTSGNTIIAGNTVVTAGPDVAGAFDSLGNNLVGETDGSSGWMSSDLVGTAADPDNAQLAPLGDNGGPTLTMALLAGSPAINSGNVALAVDANGNTLTTDQRGAGFARTIDGTVDIGAYEVQNPSETPTTTSLSTSATSSTYGQSVTLIATVSDSSGGVPTGSVEFFDGPTDLGPGTYIGGSGDSATWTFTTSTLPTAEQSLTAVYTPTELFSGSTSDNANILVNPAPLTITADNASKTYGQSVTFADTEFTTSGLVNGDSVTSVTLTSAGAAQTAGVIGSPYAVIPSSAVGSGLGNYIITYVDGNLAVNAAPLTITAENTSKTYGQTLNFAGTEFTTSGLLNGDTITSVGLSSAGTAASAIVSSSPYAIVPSDAVGSGLGNYTISYVDGNLTVNPAPLTITAENTSKTYGQSISFAGTEFTTSGLFNDDSVTSVTLASAGTAATASVAGSPFAIVPSSAAGFGLGNYTISDVDGNLTVNPAPLTITADNRSKTYGQTASLAGTAFTTSGLVNSDSVTSVSLTSAGAAPTADVAGSPYAIVPSSAAGSGLGNYTITYVNGNLTVNPAPLTITADDTSKTYGQTEAATGTAFTTSGLLNSDSVSSVSFSSAGSAPTATVAGSPYTIVPSNAVGSGLGNYTISYVDGCLTVSRAPLTITADNMSKTYGQTVTITGTAFTADGLVNSDSVTSVTLTSSGAAATATVAGSPYGIVPLKAVGSGLGNYSISYVDGTLTVTKAISEITTTPNTTSLVCGTIEILTDTATLSGAYCPAGTITFTLYSPSDTLLDTETVSVNGDGTYSTPKGHLLLSSAAPGVYQWDASYSGDNNNAAAVDNNDTREQVTVNRPSPTISTRPSTTSATCGSSVTLMDTATLSGGYDPTGTVTFTLYSPSDTLLDTETVSVYGDRIYSTPRGYSLPQNAAAGTYQWDASYSGDADNNPATDDNDKAEQVVLSASVCNGQTGSLSYWCGSQGQSLINCLNGGSNCSNLGNWLAGNCPNLFSGLAHCTNSQVAAYCNNLNNGNANQQACGQVLATAISCYVTNGNLAGYAGQSCGFTVTSNGTGAINYNVGGNGFGLGIANNSSCSVLGLVQQIDRQSAYGAINASALNAASSICGAINRAGASQNAALSDSGVVYTPAQIRAAYGISNLALDGSGQTIAIVDAYDDPDIFQSVDDFDTQLGLTSSGPTLYQQYGAASTFLTVLNQNGQTSSLPATDPSGSGTDNWEVEESLDVEWAHAIAPGAQIVLVEANSSSLSDLMAAVSTAGAQPGVSVVSMSWGFAEGQSVFASDEATYDSMFNVPGVAFVASTGDYGAADPEYPAFSPNVLAVGGTSLTLNGDGSYNSETGWGYQSQSAGVFIGSGGGISLYEPEPSYQAGVQSTGFRTAPDVSLDADPNTGAWIADAYNLDPADPFEAVGGTSVAAPVWAGLLALVDQGSAAAGGLRLNISAPTEVQQALYSLPQNDYNVISSGFNGYNAGPGYNLVTGLGTPVANLLVSDLVAYQTGTFAPSGPTVAPVQDANLVYTGTNDGGTGDAFAVFNSLIDTNAAFGSDRAALSASITSLSPTLQPAGTASQSVVTRVAMAESSLGLLPGAPQPGELAQVLGTTTISNPSDQNPGYAVSMTTAPVCASLGAPSAARSTAQARAIAAVTYFDPARSAAIDQGVLDEYRPSIASTGRVYDAVLDELGGDEILPPAHRGSAGIAFGAHATATGALEPVPGDPRQRSYLPSVQIDYGARLGVLGLAAGFWVRAREFREPRRRRAKRA